jgi:hypothetical protein
MKVHLPVNNFAFFKMAIGTAFLAAALVTPLISIYSFAIALMVGRAHSLGAWVAMWRAGKLSWRYIVWMSAIIIAVSYWGLQMVSLNHLLFVTYVLFAFHFFFDEFELQEERRTFTNLLSGAAPLLVMLLFLCRSFLDVAVTMGLMVTTALTFLALEFIYVRELTWFTIHTKILTAFILLSFHLGTSATAVHAVFLTFHYFFWFIYPVYKLHKYKREERDGFIMMLLLIVAASFYFAITKDSYGPQVYELVIRSFNIGTIVHILATAPFGYLFGLPLPKQSALAR